MKRPRHGMTEPPLPTGSVPACLNCLSRPGTWNRSRGISDGPPFRWDEERRMLMRAELDAAYFLLYGLERDEVDHVMDSFEALRRREERQLDEFRSRRLILDRYDAMAEATRNGRAYQTVLDPPPGQGPRHGARP